MHDTGGTMSSCDTSSHSNHTSSDTSDTSSHTSHTSHTGHSSDGMWAGAQHLTLNPNDPAYYYDNTSNYGNASARRSGVLSGVVIAVLVAIIVQVVILVIGFSII
jgi:hypothetical protein